jgi:gamma-glutamyltranspeptidase/glutathione hydrolase
VPRFGWPSVTVPGAPAGWAALSKRFGKLPLKEVMKAGIDYAANGYPVSTISAKLWKSYKAKLDKQSGEEFKSWYSTFVPGGKCPEAGEIMRLPDHAKTLQLIADTDAEAFYRGELAEKIDAFSAKYNGWLRGEDLADFHSEWVEPISTNYRGYDVWEIPPNGHGITALMALNILKNYQFSGDREYEPYYHKMIEAMKLAFVDAMAYVTDPKDMPFTPTELLSQKYADSRRSLIGETALDPTPGTPPKGGTVYLCTADSEGNMVSMIQSNYMQFGSGLVVPGTGIALQNRGTNFSLDPKHPNVLGPQKKPYHTIIPAFLSKDGEAMGPFGVMGGFMQPQGHLQVVTNMIDFGMNPQEALDAPRWQWVGGKNIQVEEGIPNHIVLSLARRGHNMQVVHDQSTMGRGEMIMRTDAGTLAGAAEPRTDGCVAAW